MHKVVNEWEVRYNLLPGVGDPNLPMDAWDAIPNESDSDIANFSDLESDVAEESNVEESSRRQSSGKKRRYPYTGQKRKGKKRKRAAAAATQNNSESQ